MRTLLVMVVLILLFPAVCCPALATEQPVVGAIRWDGWWHGSPYAPCLDPQQWHYRLPFYSRVVAPDQVELFGDCQQMVDVEIAYARQAGLSYWAFDYYQPQSWEGADSYNYGLKLYLSSQQNSGLNFCLIVFPDGSLGPIAEWPATVATFVDWFRQPNYQKVLGDRPLMYFYTVYAMEKFFGSQAAAREGLDYLRQKAIQAGLGPPYLVAQVWSAQEGADCVDKYGFDAVSAYAMLDFSNGNQEYPYTTLTAATEDFWEACKATGKKVIPIVMSGWDNRPLQGDQWKDLYPQWPGPWYRPPTPAELADHLTVALNWNTQNTGAGEANAALIYAWNESGEGGWLVPTLSEGSARLAAIRKVLRPSPAFPDVPLEHWALREIESCADAGIVFGYPDANYGPGDLVTRDQMAVYIARAVATPTGEAGLAGYTPPAGPSFPDVAPDHWAYKYIEFARANNIVEGYPDGEYEPSAALDRGQMAVFIARAIATPRGEAGLAGYAPPASPTFPDVPTGFWAYKHIEYIADPARAVTRGYDDGKYHPEYPCSRDQMAVYVARAFKLPL